jgi:5-formyltetrahydrofolate cyclo-ligase
LRAMTSQRTRIRVVGQAYAESVDKETLRAKVRGEGPIDPSTQALVRSGLFTWLSSRLPGTVSAFLAMPGEIDLSSLFERLPGWRWVLPRVEPGRLLTFRDKDVPRETHPFGMSQPVAKGTEIPIREIDVFLTPGLAFDMSGGRVGNGGGYYDRVLVQRRRDSVATGVTIESRVFAEVPMREHDERVDWLATERGVRECSPTT